LIPVVTPGERYHPNRPAPLCPLTLQHVHQSHNVLKSLDSPATTLSEEDEGEIEGEGDIEEAIGQLSLNEDEQVRFHGKASGLHLLAPQERVDGRSEGGIWKFPKARIWPPLPPTERSQLTKEDGEFVAPMPPLEEQERLLDLYWKYVHTALPIVYKQSFLENFRRGSVLYLLFTIASADIFPALRRTILRVPQIQFISQPRSGRTGPYTPILLLAMFSVAARYTGQHGSEVSGTMWPAGDSYFKSAKAILASTYSPPRIGTCQALLLLGYREVGIGAMAQAWIYMRMAIAMAQDLGMHKTAEKWRRTGGNMFTRAELQERRRIWYACIVMDKYMSSYIGRPVAISARDFDTELPSEDAVSSFIEYFFCQLMKVRCQKMEEHEVLELQATPNAPARDTE
jgi:hypothetical protein